MRYMYFAGRSLKVRNIRVDGAVYIWLAIGVLILPLSWQMAGILAAIVHEICHYLAATVFRVRIRGMRIGIGGMLMHMEPMPAGKEFAIAMAGPAGSLLLTLFLRRWPELAVYGMIQGLYNLIPVYPLDGGRALEGVMRMLLPERWIRPAADLIEGILLAALVTVGFLSVFVWKLGIIPLLVAVLLVIQRKNRKIPCKWGALKVQ